MSHTIIISLSKPITTTTPTLSKPTSHFPHHLILRKNPHQKRTLLVVTCKSYDGGKGEGKEMVENEDNEWPNNLPEKNKALYAHSLMSIEAWLRQLGFRQSTEEDPAAWVVENREWHAYLSLDVTDLSIRYLKTGPGNLEKDVERRFSYALSREDIENAILGGP